MSTVFVIIHTLHCVYCVKYRVLGTPFQGVETRFHEVLRNTVLTQNLFLGFWQLLLKTL